MSKKKIRNMFDPDSVAVIGASEEKGSVGRDLVENLKDGFRGEIYPINPNHQSILDIKSYPSVKDVGSDIDLAVIAVPSEIVPDVLEECGEVGIKSSIIISSGFSESGQDGEELEEKLREIRKEYGMRILGPNCMGILSPHSDLNLSFFDKRPNKGNTAFVSQSGALGSAMLDWSTESNVGISNFVSVGNMMDVNFADLIEYLGEEENTEAILLYIEGISDPDKFIETARNVSPKKPIFVLKSGKYSKSAEAVASHTGSLAGKDEVYDAAFRRSGITRLDDVEEFFDCANFLSNQSLPKGPNILVVTNAGGPGVLTTDAILSEGGRLADLSDSTIEEFEGQLPKGSNTSNPVDVLGDTDEDRYRKVIKTCSKDDSVDALIVIYTPQGSASSMDVAKTLTNLNEDTNKPLMTSLIGGEKILDARNFLKESNVIHTDTPERAVITYMNTYRNVENREFLSKISDEGFEEIQTNKQGLREKLEKVAKEGRSVLTEVESKEFLDSLGIPTSTTKVAESREESVKIAEDIGYPVAMKVYSREISHKSDVGGVILDLENSDEVREAFENIMDNMNDKKPEAEIDGVTVQEMVDMDYGLILGCKRDRVFGPVVMFGRGGRDVELYNDTALDISPLNRTLARDLVNRTNVHKFLNGYRDYPSVDNDELLEYLVRFSYLLEEFPRIKEVDVNPLAVDNGKMLAIDARIILNGK